MEKDKPSVKLTPKEYERYQELQDDMQYADTPMQVQRYSREIKALIRGAQRRQSEQELEAEPVDQIDHLRQKATALRNQIKNQERTIDNPAMVLSTLSALDFFIENLETDQSED